VSNAASNFRWLPHGAAPKDNSEAAEVTMNALVDLVIYTVSIGLVCGLLLWFIDQAPIDEHSHRVARIAIIVVAISLIISVLLWAAASQIG
jgi:Flp pilus assembly protein protease CpaA